MNKNTLPPLLEPYEKYTIKVFKYDTVVNNIKLYKNEVMEIYPDGTWRIARE